MKILLAPNNQVGDYWKSQLLQIGVKIDKIVTSRFQLVRTIEPEYTFHLFGDRHNFFKYSHFSTKDQWDELMDYVAEICQRGYGSVYDDFTDITSDCFTRIGSL